MNIEERRRKDREYYARTKERRSELNKKRYNSDKGKFYKNNRNSVLKRKYGISLEEYNIRLEEQDFSCLICNGEEIDRQLAVDHDHKTGKVRGLLCGSCNRALGLFKDSPELMEKAINYLKENSN